MKLDEFELDPRLEHDCLVMGNLDISMLLLMNNALVPWFILVPRTSKTEFVDLSAPDQSRVVEETNIIAAFIKENFNATRLNIASIGNIVSQLHVHVVGRDPSDFCWPGVVWGQQEKQIYTEKEVDKIIGALRYQLGEKFTV